MSDDFLASLGLQPAVVSHTIVDACSNETSQGATYPTGVVSSLAATAVIQSLMLGYLAYKFSPILAQYLRDGIESLMSNSPDSEYRLTYECVVRGTIMSSVLMGSERSPEPLVLEEVAATAVDEASEFQLSEIVIQ